MKKAISCLLLFLGYNLLAQVTIAVEQLPENTPKDAKLYVSGDFEGWTGGNEKHQLTEKDGKYYITIPQKEINILFKLTLGSWASVECKADGDKIDNRTYNFTKANDTLKLKVAGWTHLMAPKEKATATKNVRVLAEEFEIPQLKAKRRIWIYLPPDYHVSNEKYPVVYMHDGQNLFDKLTSFSGEWGVDETLNHLFKEKNLKLIVIGIDNGGKERLNEYAPWVNKKYGGGKGKAYVDFIVNTLKPYIDANFNTLKDKANTGIIGSSMGGLISHYAGLKYPQVFGKVGVFSPAFWFSPEVKTFSKENANISDTKMYFLAGAKEGENVSFNEISQTAKDMNAMTSLLKKNGFYSANITSKIVPEGKHNEALWKTNFEEAILWLFKDKIKYRTFSSASFNDNELKLKVSDGSYIIKFYGAETVETTFIPLWDTANTKESHAVVLKDKFKEVIFIENDENIQFKTEKLIVAIQKAPFKISYLYNGEELVSEKNGYQRNDDYETIRFGITKEEVLYGGGSRALGMNRRGNRLQLYNRAHYGYEENAPLMNFSMPIVLSSKKYILHFDNAPIGYLDLDSKNDNTISYETISGRKTYQVVAGDSWYNLINNYTNLTGKQPLPPRWALGNFSSRFGYHSEKETERTIQKFKEDKIPVDAVILDLFWFGKTVKGTMGNLEVYKDSFPDFEGMIKRLADKKVKTVLITEPFVVSTSKKWKEAVAKDILAKDSIGNPARYDFYFGNTGIIDIYKPEAKQWFWNIYKGLINKGVAGLWGDLGEPEVHPSWVQHAKGSADEIHNVYGHDWAKLIQEGYQKYFPNKRPFILMRAGYSGSQRFGMIPWSGDVNRTWGGLASQPEISLQMGMQGIGYMHSDLGGFAGDNLDDELYARWLQYGVFQPIYRPHAQEAVPSEPVFRSKEAKERAKRAIELRYQLLPYNYHLAFENHVYGTPLMRPLFFEYKDEITDTLVSTYLWGSNFLVSPQLKEDTNKHKMYLPNQSVWFDFYTDKRIVGTGKKVTVTAKKYSIPTLVKAGAFIPMTKIIQNTNAYDANNLIIHYYYDATVNSSKQQLYNDDGETPKAYENGAYELISFKSKNTSKSINIELNAEIGEQYKSVKKAYEFVIHNIQEQPKEVKIGRKKQNFEWDKEKKTLHIPLKWKTNKEKTIKIEL